jgi:membrane-bound lytic murein transglycosylase D
MVASWIRKSGRYGAAIRRILREHGLPEDVLWLSLVESGFDPTVQSPAGAAGLWQFMPEGARIYGLTVDRWTDERLDPERSTIAAARYLADLRQRFGGWELAFAAYNMGYGGLLASIRKYNTNDFWELSRIEAGVPLETALYVPKIVALAIVARNRAVFGCDTIELDSPVPFDRIAVGPGVSLETIASAAGVPTSAIEELNPQFLAARTPPLGRGASPPDAKAGGAGASAGATDGTPWEVRVPAGTGPKAARALERLVHRGERLARYVVRWGETIDDIAARTRTKRSHIVSLNALRRDEVPRPGTVLLVPARAADAADATTTSARAEAPVVVVPDQTFSYRDRARVFYRVVPGDTLRDLANVFSVSADELCRWNALDPGATLQEGMTLQVFPPPSADLRNVVVLAEKQARILRVGTPEFFAHFEAQKGRKRIEVVAREGDTWRSIGKRYGLSAGMLERINRKSRTTPVRPGDKLVVYVPLDEADAAPDEERADERPEVAVASAEGSVGTGSGLEGADGDGDDAKDEESATPEEGEAKEGATRPAVLEREPSPSPDAKKND